MAVVREAEIDQVASPPGRYSTLADLRSRWITSCRWISCSASASFAPSAATSSAAHGASRIHSESGLPSTYSMTRYGVVSTSPKATSVG